MAEMLLDLADPEELSLTARGIPFPTGVFNRWFPAKSRRDHRYRFFRKDRKLGRAIPLRAWDTPAVPISRGEVEEVTGRMLPLSGILWLDEEDAAVLDAIRDSEDAEVIGDVFDDDLRRLTEAALQRLMLLQGEAIVTGKIQIGTQASPENGLWLPPVDFAVPSSNIFTASTLWSAGSPAILDQLTTWKQQYVQGTGQEVAPAYAVTSTRVFNEMASDPTFVNAYATVFGTPPTVGIDEVNSLLAKRQLPQLIVDDSAVPDIKGAMTREFPDDRVILLPERPVGATQWGITQEAKKLARAQAISDANAPGLIAVPMEDENPVRTGTLVSGIAMPVITDPDLVMTVKVL